MEYQSNKTTNLNFRSLTIEVDSHARDLASLVQQRVKRTTAVTGVCKPGAKLLAVTSGAPPPPGSYYVLLAGTNDITAGKSENLFRNLKQHGLTEHHPVNQQTNLVNSYIVELCYIYEELHLLDFNTIKRRWFNGHGMHLRAAEKRLLAELIHQNLVKIDPPVSKAKEMPPPPTLLKPEEPRELPFDTYAEAIKSSHIKPANGHSQCPLQSLRLQLDANCTDDSNIENHVFRASTSSQQTKLTDPNLK
ncbi:hypothetical protein J6590_083663 [Homalodisca vitripennis]|nr:hypothetical protein J6590_083663 [Homalodisca vitripennis]